MSAYVLVEITVHNPQEYEEYKKLSLPSLTPFGGRFIVRGGQTYHLEGDWDPGRIVILEFPSREKVLEWWNSEIYAEAKKIRQRAASTRMIVVEGVCSGLPTGKPVGYNSI